MKKIEDPNDFINKVAKKLADGDKTKNDRTFWNVKVNPDGTTSLTLPINKIR